METHDSQPTTAGSSSDNFISHLGLQRFKQLQLQHASFHLFHPPFIQISFHLLLICLPFGIPSVSSHSSLLFLYFSHCYLNSSFSSFYFFLILLFLHYNFSSFFFFLILLLPHFINPSFSLHRIDPDDALNIIRNLCPDIACFVISLVTLVCCQAWFKPTNIRLSCSRLVDDHICKCSNLLSLYLGNLATVVLIATAGILLPSLLNLVYFLVVISSMTTWSLVLRHRLAWFQRIRFFTVAYTGLHLLTIYLRQFPVVAMHWNAYLPEGSLMDR